MVGLGEQFLFRDLVLLVRREALVAEQDADGVLRALPRIADRHQIVAHGVQAQIQRGLKNRIAADLAGVNGMDGGGHGQKGAVYEARMLGPGNSIASPCATLYP